MKKKGESIIFLFMNGRILATAIFSVVGIASLLADTRGGFEAALGAGYRKDQMFLSLDQRGDLLYKERSRDLRGVALDAYLDLHVRGVFLSSIADCGWFVSGRTHDLPVVGGFGQPQTRASFRESADGWFADAQERLGYVFDFMSCRRGLQLIPEVGYDFFYQQLTRGNNRPYPYEIPGVASFSYNLSYARFLRQWWGPLAGGMVRYSPIPSWSFEVGWCYHFLQNILQEFGALEQLSGLGVSQYFAQVNHRIRTSDAHGQSFYAKVKAQIAASWNINLHFNIDRFSSHDNAAIDRRHVREFLPTSATSSETHHVGFHALWRSFSVLSEIEYFF